MFPRDGPPRGAGPERWGVVSLQVMGRFPGILAALHRPVILEGCPWPGTSGVHQMEVAGAVSLQEGSMGEEAAQKRRSP